MTKSLTPRLLIDGDLLTFAACSAAQEDFEWCPGIWSTWVNHTDAYSKFLKDFNKLIDTAKEALSAKDRENLAITFCLAGPNNFRKAILPTYKAHRGRKPAGYAEFLERVQDEVAKLPGVTVYRREGIEADDCLGILGTYQTTKYRNIIWSLDKDLRMVPCEHLSGNRIVPAEDGWEQRHAYQTLVGDTADGYKGLPGCGPVAAKKIIDGGPADELWQRIEAAFVKKGLTKEDMLQQARVAKICTADDYDFKAQKVKIWSP